MAPESDENRQFREFADVIQVGRENISGTQDVLYSVVLNLSSKPDLGGMYLQKYLGTYLEVPNYRIQYNVTYIDTASSQLVHAIWKKGWAESFSTHKTHMKKEGGEIDVTRDNFKIDVCKKVTSKFSLVGFQCLFQSQWSS